MEEIYLPKTWDVLTCCLIKNHFLYSLCINSASQPRGPVVILQCCTRILRINSTDSSLLSQSNDKRAGIAVQRELSRVAPRRTAPCVFTFQPMQVFKMSMFDTKQHNSMPSSI